MRVPLAYNAQGQWFAVPETVTAWHVRRMRPRGERGALEPVYHPETGVPLTVPVDTTPVQLRSLVAPGRHRLDAIGEDGQPHPDVPAAYVEVMQPQPRNAAPFSADDEWPWNDSRSGSTPDHEAMRLTVKLAESVIQASMASAEQARLRDDRLAELLAESTRATTRLSEALVNAMTPVMGATGNLLVAVDSSKSARLPPPPLALPPAPDTDEDEDDDDEDDGNTTVRWLEVVENVMAMGSMVMSKLAASGVGGLPLDAVVDWRRAQSSKTTSASGAAPAAAAAAPAQRPSAPAPSPARTPPQTVRAEAVPAAPSARPTATSDAEAAPVPAVTSVESPMPAAPASSAASSAGVAVAPTASETSADESTPSDVDSSAPAPESDLAPEPSKADIAAAVNAHMMQIFSSLSMAERARAQQIAAALSPEEQSAWLIELSSMTVPDAVVRIRELLRPAIAAPTQQESSQ